MNIRKFFIRFNILWVCIFTLPCSIRAKDRQQIKTPHFCIIYDKAIHQAAWRVVNTLETCYGSLTKTLCGAYFKPIRPIRCWLVNDSTISNGSTSLVPRYISLNTFYSSDPNFIGNVDWLSLLCIHEYRHVVQFEVQHRSLPLLLRPLVNLTASHAFLGVPRFFSEGDAVGIETALTRSGRGRLPGWERSYRVHLLERAPAGLGMQLFGSYRYELPDYYHIGYYLATHIRRKYGSGAIQTIYERSIWGGVPFFGFYYAIKKATGKSLLKVYQEMNQELFASWSKQLDGLPITPVVSLTQKKRDAHVHYSIPFVDRAGNLLALKHGLGVRAQLVMFRPMLSRATVKAQQPATLLYKEAKRLLFVLNKEILPAHFAIGQEGMVWLEAYKHPWKGSLKKEGEVFCMRLRYYDFNTQKRRTLVRDAHYHTLAMSPSGRQLVVVDSDKQGKHHLVILETAQGKELQRISYPGNGYYLTPSWDGENQIVVTETQNQMNRIFRIHVETGIQEELLSPAYEHRNTPKIYKDYVLYNSSYNGIDNIYALHLPTKAIFQVTSRQHGAYLGMVDPMKEQLIFNDFSKDGMSVVAMPFDPATWIPLQQVKNRSVGYYEPLVVAEGNAQPLDRVPTHSRYPVTHYAWQDDLTIAGCHLESFNFSPLSFQLNLFPIETLSGNMQLSPFSLGYQHGNINGAIAFKTQWGYPVLSAQVRLDKFMDEEQGGHRWQWKEGITFPYHFTLNTFSGQANLNIDFVQQFTKDKAEKRYAAFCFPEISFDVDNGSTKSDRDICKPWNQFLKIIYKQAKLNNKDKVHMVEGKIYFWIPGFFNHHYMLFGLEGGVYQKFSTKKFDQSQDSGKNIMFKSVYQRDLIIKYGFPLFYPDWDMLPLLCFLKRIALEGYWKLNEIYSLLDLKYIKKVEKAIRETRAEWKLEHTVGLRFDFLKGLLTYAGMNQEVRLGIGGEIAFKSFNDKAWTPQFIVEVNSRRLL